MKRRSFLPLLGAGMMLSVGTRPSRAEAVGDTLLTAGLRLHGDWGGSASADLAAVIECMRAACLEDVALLSDRQPQELWVENRPDGNPAVWLHADLLDTAWVMVVVGTREWCNLAYQFGHELGHVLANSWTEDAMPRNPCQWVEEALVEAFSLRGLGRMAETWSHAPPFPDDQAYARSIWSYREAIRLDYRSDASNQGVDRGLAAWFEARKGLFASQGGIDAAAGAVTTMLELLESDAAMCADIGALNRWPERSGVPLDDYLKYWQASCAELNAPGRLPLRIRQLLGH